jgi:hypothetical protein
MNERALLEPVQQKFTMLQLIRRLSREEGICSIHRDVTNSKQMRTDYMLEMARLLIRTGRAFVYGGFIRDLLFGQPPNDLDVGFSDHLRTKDLIGTVKDFATNLGLRAKVEIENDGFSRMSLFTDAQSSNNYGVRAITGETSSCGSTSNFGDFLFFIDLTRVNENSQKVWVDCDVNNLKIEHSGDTDVFNVCVKPRLAALNCKFWNLHGPDQEIQNVAFDLNSILSNLENKQFDLFLPAAHQRIYRIHGRIQKLLSRGIYLRRCYLTLDGQHLEAESLADHVPYGMEQSASGKLSSSLQPSTLDDVECKSVLSFAMVLKSSVFQGSLNRVGSFVNRGDIEEWRGSDGCELVGEYDDGYRPVECSVKENSAHYLAIFDGRLQPWQRPKPQKSTSRIQLSSSNL